MSNLRRNMLSGSATTIINILVAALGYSIYINKLGYKQYGVWLILSTILSFVQLGNLGLMPVIIKLVAQEKENNNFEMLQKYVTTAIYLLLTSGLLFLVTTLLFNKHIVGLFKLAPTDTILLENMMPYMGLFSVYIFLVQVYTSVLSGTGYMNISNYIDSICRVIALIISVLLIDHGFGINGLFAGTVISYLLMHMATMVVIRKQMGVVTFTKVSFIDIDCSKKLLRLSSGVFGGSIIIMLVNPFNKLMLSRSDGPASVAVYEIAFNASMQLRALFESAFRAITPEVSRYAAKLTNDKMHHIHHIAAKSIKIIFTIATPIWFLIIVFSEKIIDVWLRGNADPNQYQSFRIMLVAIFISLFGVPFYYILIGLGDTTSAFKCNVIQSLICFTGVLTLQFVGLKISVISVGAVMCIAVLMSTLYLYVTYNKYGFKQIIKT